MQICFKLICTLKFHLQYFLTNTSHRHHHLHSHSGSGPHSVINPTPPLTGQHSASSSPLIFISLKRGNTKDPLQDISGAESPKSPRRPSESVVLRSTNPAASRRIQPQMLCYCVRAVVVLSDSTRVGGDDGAVSSLFASDIPDLVLCFFYFLLLIQT